MLIKFYALFLIQFLRISPVIYPLMQLWGCVDDRGVQRYINFFLVCFLGDFAVRFFLSQEMLQKILVIICSI
jgi:hypothetical protein